VIPCELSQRVEASIAARHLLGDGQRVLVAVSGGLDSMVLLDLLRGLAAKHRWRLVVAHFNHRLRGAASDADERFVGRAAKRLGLDFVCERWARDRQKAIKRLGLEMAARLARHEFLARSARLHKTSTIALAHHADDQSELFFLRLLRGSGGEGLSGMKWRGPSPADGRCTLIRPLLDARRLDLEAYAQEQRLPFREDASNRDARLDRNWLRRKLLPALIRRFGTGVVPAILRTMELAGCDADYAREVATAWLSGRRRPPFERLRPAVQRQCLRLQLKRMGLTAGFDLVERLRQFPRKPIAATPSDVVRRDDAGLVARIHPRDKFRFDELTVNLAATDGCEFQGVVFTWTRGKAPRPFRRPAPRAGAGSFDAAKVGSAIRLRHWRPGDRFQPIGMNGRVKLQDLFTNAKIPAARRRRLVVAEAASGEIFWVEGLRIGELCKLGPWTRERLQWRWRRTDKAVRTSPE
jgi:tRNA(Ile)-lysidine synthase